jgi:hypothetical protein
MRSRSAFPSVQPVPGLAHIWPRLAHNCAGTGLIRYARKCIDPARMLPKQRQRRRCRHCLQSKSPSAARCATGRVVARARLLNRKAQHLRIRSRVDVGAGDSERAAAVAQYTTHNRERLAAESACAQRLARLARIGTEEEEGPRY